MAAPPDDRPSATRRASQPTEITYPSGLKVEWIYDGDGRGFPITQTITPRPNSGLLTQVKTWDWNPWFNLNPVTPIDYRLASKLKRYTDSSGFEAFFTHQLETGSGVQSTVEFGPSGSRVLTRRIQENAQGRVEWIEEAPIAVDGGGTSTVRKTFAYGIVANCPEYRLLKTKTETEGSTTYSVTFGYEGPGWLESVQDELGRLTTLQNDSLGRVVKVVEPAAASGYGTATLQGITLVERDSRGAPTKIRRLAYARDGNPYPRGQVETQLVYDVFGRLWRQRQDRAPLTQGDQQPEDWIERDFEYDTGDRLLKVERAGHEVTVQDWDGQGRLAAIHTLLNGTETRTRTWGFDADGLDVEIRDSTAISIVASRDGFGRVQTVTRTGGQALAHVYDAGNRLTQVDRKSSGVVRTSLAYVHNPTTKRLDAIQQTDPTAPSKVRQLAFTYNGFFRVSRIVDQNGRARSRFYDARGRLVRTTDDLLGAGVGNSETYARDAVGNVLQALATQKRDLGSSGWQDIVYKTTFDYNAWDQLLAVHRFGTSTSALAHEYLAYDSLGNRTWAQDSVLKVVEESFDALGRPLVTTRYPRPGASGSPVVTKIVYGDAPGSGRSLVVSRQDGLSNPSLYDYDLVGRLVKRQLPGHQTGSGKTWTYAYDTEDRLLSWVDGNGALVKVGYDTQKRPVARWLAQSGSVPVSAMCTNETFAYDDLDRQSRATTWWIAFGDLSGPSASAPTLVRADRNLDVFDRMESEVFGYWDDGSHNPPSAAIKTVASGWIVSGQSEDFEFRRRLMTANGFTQDMVPDAAGKLAAVSLTGPGTISLPGYASYRYEGSRVFRRDIQASGSASSLWTQHGYDFLGQLVRLTTRYGSGQPSDPLRFDLEITRDFAGNVLDLRYAKVSGRLGDLFTLDGHDRLLTAKLGVDAFTGTPAFDQQIEYALDAAHNRQTVTTIPGLTETYTRTAGTNEYADVSGVPHTWDGNGNLTSDGYYVYVYDYLDRLSEVYLLTYPGGAMVQSGSTKTLVRPSAKDQRERKGVARKHAPSRIRELVTSARSRVRPYVKTGMRSGTGSAVNEGLAASADEPVLEFVAWYGYDGSNRRVWKLTVFENTWTTWDGWNPADELDGAWGPAKSYVSPGGLSEHLGYAVRDAQGGWTLRCYVVDHLGGVRKVADASGSIVEQYEYDPYGRQAVFDAQGAPRPFTAVQNLRGFTGHMHDLETGLVYMRNRHYSVGLGRFVSTDRIDIWTDIPNLGSGYAYVGSMPQASFDPLGDQGAGHHWIVQEIWNPSQQNNLGFSKAAQEVFNEARTGDLGEFKELNRFDQTHRDYNAAQREWLERNTTPEQRANMTRTQAKGLVRRLLRLPDARIQLMLRRFHYRGVALFGARGPGGSRTVAIQYCRRPPYLRAPVGGRGMARGINILMIALMWFEMDSLKRQEEKERRRAQAEYQAWLNAQLDSLDPQPVPQPSEGTGFGDVGGFIGGGWA